MPLVRRVLNGHACQPPGPQRNPAHRLVGDVPLVVGVDHILRGPGPGAQGRRKLRPVGGNIDLVKRQRVEGSVVERPLQRDGARFLGEDRIEQRPVGGGLHVERDIRAAAYVNHFMIHGHGLPTAIGGLVVALAVEFFHVKVLHVGKQRGEAPGHMLVVPGNYKRHTRQRDSGSVVSGGAQVGHEPDVGLRQAQVHVVREQRLAAGRVLAGDDPVVRAGGAPGAGGQAQQVAQSARVFVHGGNVGGSHARFGALIFVLGVRRRGRFGVRLAQVQQNSGGRMIAPRTDRVKIGLQLGVVQLGRNLLARELGVPMRVEHLHHRQAYGDRVFSGPGARAIEEQLELRRQRMGMLVDEKIDAARVLIQPGAVRGGQVWHKRAAPCCGIAALAAPCRASRAMVPESRPVRRWRCAAAYPSATGDPGR